MAVRKGGRLPATLVALPDDGWGSGHQFRPLACGHRLVPHGGVVATPTYQHADAAGEAQVPST